MVNWSKNFLRPKTVRFLCNLVLRKTLLLCGYVEKNFGPFNTSNLSTFDKVLDPSPKFLKFFLMNARSIQNKNEDLSNVPQQLVSQTILIVTETGIPEQQYTKFNISNEHLFLQKARSKQTGVQRGGVFEFESTETSMLNVRKNLRKLMQIFLNKCGSKLMNP